MILGFSTGSLAKGDFVEALDILSSISNPALAIELSTLRESELPLLIKALPFLDLHRYKYISIHAPSKLLHYSEDEVITYLLKIKKYNFPIIVHPDIITDYTKWEVLGTLLCIENMDKRKAIGRTAEDLELIFQRLPNARFCLDLAHAKQVDPSMVECVKMLRMFSDRLIQFHISDVTSDCNHVPINLEAIEAYRKVAKLIPTDIPFIIESPVSRDYFVNELIYISSIFHINNNYNNNHHSFISEHHEHMKSS
jgi:hypothetical protein